MSETSHFQMRPVLQHMATPTERSPGGKEGGPSHREQASELDGLLNIVFRSITFSSP